MVETPFASFLEEQSWGLGSLYVPEFHWVTDD